MTRPRSIMLFISLLVMTSVLAVACGTIEPDSLAFADVDADQTTLRIATSRIEGFEAAIASWEDDHPTVDVEIVLDSSDDHHEWIRNGMSGQVDIVAFEGEYGAEVRSLPERFVDLRELGLGDLADDFLPVRWEEGTAEGGELIGLPVDVDAQVLIVRRDLLRPSTTRNLLNASGWCDVIQAGNDFANESGVAFFADGDEVLQAILSQSRLSWVAPDGSLDPGAETELLWAWDLAMLTVGADSVGTTPCPELTDRGTIARDLTPGEAVWNTEIASDQFAAVIAQWSTRDLISQAYPESGGRWLTIPLPIDQSFGPAGTSSEGGLHFGVSADSANIDIALDFLLTITNPVTQQSTFADGLGPLPAIRSAYTDGSVARVDDGFLVGRPTVGAAWSAAVAGRSELIASAERPIVVSALSDALARVQADLDSPEEAWDNAVRTIIEELDQR